MAKLKDLIVNGAARILGNTYVDGSVTADKFEGPAQSIMGTYNENYMGVLIEAKGDEDSDSGGIPSMYRLEGHEGSGVVVALADAAKKLVNQYGGVITTGSTQQPIYFQNGIPVVCSYSLNKSVPADAKFTDTTYTSLKNPYSLTIQGNGTTLESYDGSSAKTVNLTYSNVGAAAASHTHNYAGSSSAGGAATSANKLNTNAGSANSPVYFENGVPKACTAVNLPARTAGKLANARKIDLSGAVEANSAQFDGSADVNLDVTEVKEAYLTWGGQHHKGKFGPLDAALIPSLGANRFALIKPAGVTIEYSPLAADEEESKRTWATDTSASDNKKIGLFTQGIEASVYLGGSSATGINKSKYQTRITINTVEAGVYTKLEKIALLISTNGSDASQVTIEGRRAIEYSAGSNTWRTLATASLGGWSGWNIVQLPDGVVTWNGVAANEAQYAQIRFTFSGGNHGNTRYNGLLVMNILGFGGVGWTCPSTLARTGNVYTLSADRKVTFPGDIAFAGGSIIDGVLSVSSVAAPLKNYHIGTRPRKPIKDLFTEAPSFGDRHYFFGGYSEGINNGLPEDYCIAHITKADSGRGEIIAHCLTSGRSYYKAITNSSNFPSSWTEYATIGQVDSKIQEKIDSAITTALNTSV